MNTKGRLFTFGCSLTRYHYPTWADILGREWNYFENWGDPGSGNHAIFNSVIECDARNNFDYNDTVIILWSALARLDTYQNFKWAHKVNLFVDDDPSACCPDGYEIHSYAYFSAVQGFLATRGCRYIPMSWNEYFPNSRIGKLYCKVLDKILKVNFDFNKKKYRIHQNRDQFVKYSVDLYEKIKGQDWPTLDDIFIKNFQNCAPEIQIELENFLDVINNDPRFKISDRIDNHPTPLQHLNMIDQYFHYPVISDSTRSWINDIEKKLLAGQNFNFQSKIPKERF